MVTNQLYYYLFLVTSVVNGIIPVTYRERVSSQCGQSNPLQDKQLLETLSQIQQQLGRNHPQGGSCQEILQWFPSAPSDFYQIQISSCSVVQVFYDMEETKCGRKGG